MKVNIYDLSDVTESGRKYGGMAGAKLGIKLNNENWLIKFPKSTRGFNTIEISYTTTPLSEYLGSHIYKSIGIDVHETILGVKDEKVVVVCKDFKKEENEFYEFREIKNDYVEGLEDKINNLSSTSSKDSIDIDEIMLIMNNNPTFTNNIELVDRFWDMFIIDSLIGNNDRNNGNWGILVDKNTNKVNIAPVYDNGASFNNSISDERIKLILENEEKFINSVYNSSISAFSKNDKKINPLKYIESMENKDLNYAILRIVPRINLKEIEEIINSVPNKFNNLEIISDTRKKFYIETIKYRYNNILLPIYKKIKDFIENTEIVYENKNAHITKDNTIELDNAPIIETEYNNNNNEDEDDNEDLER